MMMTVEMGKRVGKKMRAKTSQTIRNLQVKLHLKSPLTKVQTQLSLSRLDIISVTILGNLLDFGQLSKAFGNNEFSQISHILSNFCKGVKIYHFSSEIIFGQLL